MAILLRFRLNLAWLILQFTFTATVIPPLLSCDMRFSGSDGPTNSSPAQTGSSAQAIAAAAEGAHSAAGGSTTEATTAATKAAEATAPGRPPRSDPEAAVAALTAAVCCPGRPVVQRRTRRRRPCPSCRREVVIVDWERTDGARGHLKGGGGGGSAESDDDRRSGREDLGEEKRSPRCARY